MVVSLTLTGRFKTKPIKFGVGALGGTRKENTHAALRSCARFLACRDRATRPGLAYVRAKLVVLADPICERSNQLSALAGRLLWRYRERERSQIIVQCTLYNVQSSRWELYNVHRALYIVHVPLLFEIMIMHICNEIKLGLKDRCLIF